MKRSAQLVLSGYYGCGNAGDEAVLAGIRDSFQRRAGNSVRLVALSQDPEATTRLHGIPSAYRMNVSTVRQTLRDSDLLISGGGSLLQDTTSVRSLLYYLWVARMAYSLNVPVMFYAQGIGPLRRPMSRALVRMVANKTAAITVRDPSSARLLTSIGVTQRNLEVTADPAFALSPAAPEAVDACFAAEELPTDEPLIAVALRPWGGVGESPVANYARLLTELEKQCGMRAVLLPMHVPDDMEFGAQVAEQWSGPTKPLRIQNAYTPSVLLGVVARMQAVVAMRLHALIFAARVAVPPFALSYDPKVESLMQGLNMADALEHWAGFDPEEVGGKVANLLAECEQRTAALRARSAELETLALRNADIALRLL